MTINHFLGAATGDHTRVLLTLFIMLVAAKLMAELFERLRQPAVAGEIIAGVVIGPGLLNLAAPSEAINILAEIGVIFLLFNVGLETKPTAIFKVGKQAALVAVLGVVAPFIGGWLLMRLCWHCNGRDVGWDYGSSPLRDGVARRTDSAHHPGRSSYRRHPRAIGSRNCIEFGCWYS